MRDTEARAWIGLLENYTKQRISSSDQSIAILNVLYNQNKQLLEQNIDMTCKQAARIGDVIEKFDALMTHLNLEFEDIKPGIRVKRKGK